VATKALIVSRLAKGRLAAAERQKTDAKKNSGFSLLELTVVIIIVSLLAVIVIARLLAIMVDAERVTMETVAGTLRSALGITVAEAIVKQDLGALETLEGSNPMERLAETPTNYLGAFDSPDPASFEDGNWYFDRRVGELVYLVRNREHFGGGAVNPPRARFMVRLVYTDRNGNGQFDRGIDSTEGLRLAPVEPYRWRR
jgi:prepilin-type N-terminal cleavage/methylation domain-containing protein